MELLWRSLHPRKPVDRLAFAYGSNWEANLREVLQNQGYTLEDVQGRIYDTSGRPVDILYLGILTAEHFPLQLELPDTGTKASLQLKLEFRLDDVGGKEEEDTSFLPLMSGRKRRGSLRRSQSLQSLVNNVGRVLRVYVQASCNGQGQVQKTSVQEVEQGCSTTFLEEEGLFFQVGAASELGRKATELLSAVRIAVYDKRNSWIRGDALVGEGWLYLPQEDADPEVHRGKPVTQKLKLYRRGVEVETQVTVTFTLLKVDDARATLAQSAKHSLLSVARALVQLAQVPGGVSLLLKSCPKELRNVTKEEIYEELHQLQQLLLEPWAESDEELCLEKMSDIARQLLDFVERHADPDADIPKLIVEWMLHLSAQVPVRGAVRGTSTREALTNEGRLRRFLESAQLRLEGLVPIDAEGAVDAAWKKEAVALREIGNWHYALMHLPETAVLGRGSFGTVWRAKDAHTGRCYAVKNVTVPPRGLAKTAQRESDVADRLSKEPHRCVVQLFHAKHFPDLRLYCFVMELCSKGSLTEHLRQIWQREEDYVPSPEAFFWIGQVLLGIEHLHTMGMLVRDLKPDNVVLSDEGRNAKPLAKLTDFGLCRFGTEATGEWTFGAPPGTPAYIAPEVIKGQDYGKGADLYSFGAVIWVILAGGIKVEGRTKVEPPCAAMAHKWDYSALAHNHQLIAACIARPEETGAKALPSKEAEDLVLSLIKEEADQRPSLEELRRHPLLSPLKLPRPSASSKEVDAWLALLAQKGCLSCGGEGCGLCRCEPADDVSPLRGNALGEESPRTPTSEDVGRDAEVLDPFDPPDRVQPAEAPDPVVDPADPADPATGATGRKRWDFRSRLQKGDTEQPVAERTRSAMTPSAMLAAEEMEAEKGGDSFSDAFGSEDDLPVNNLEDAEPEEPKKVPQRGSKLDLREKAKGAPKPKAHSSPLRRLGKELGLSPRSEDERPKAKDMRSARSQNDGESRRISIFHPWYR